jgi:SAM-dependent methyltransferase
MDERIAAEAAAVRDEYARRDRDPALARYYLRVTPAFERGHARRRLRFVATLRAAGQPASMRVLDIGAGTLEDLLYLVRNGFTPQNLVGVDLRIDAFAQGAGAIRRVGADAARLPFRDATFDASLQTTVLSSVMDADVRTAIARELIRVTRPGGVILSFDLRRIGRGPRRIVAIDRAELGRLFPGRSMRIDTEYLDLRVASRVPARAARLLEQVPVLRSHLFAVVTR